MFWPTVKKWYLLVSSTHSFSFCINGSLGRWIWVNRPWPRRLLLLYWLLFFITPAQWSKIKNSIQVLFGTTKIFFWTYSGLTNMNHCCGCKIWKKNQDYQHFFLFIKFSFSEKATINLPNLPDVLTFPK